MTAKRIVAVLAAAALIGAAFLLRRNVIEDDADATDDSVPVTTDASAAAAVVCATELAAACAAISDDHPELTVTVEPAGTTLDRLAQLPDDAEAPVWLTVAPFPEMVDALRATTGLAPLDATEDVLASTRLAVATRTGRAGVLASGCAGAPLWRCIGEHASAPWTDLGGEPQWGTLRPSVGLVEREALALGSFAAAVAGYLGTPEYTSSAWAADPAFIAWYSRLAGAVDPLAVSADSPLATMITRPAIDIAATSDAERAALGAPAEPFDPSYPEPSMWMEAVIAVPDGTATPDDLRDVAAGALGATWDAPSAATQPLPGATTMLALRALWQEAT